MTNENLNDAVLRAEFGLLSQEQVSALLQVRKETLREWRRLKQGPNFVRVGKRVFYRRDDVVAYINSHVVSPKASDA